MAPAALQRLIDGPPLLCRAVRQSPLFRVLQQRKLANWVRRGRPHPPPNILKQTTVREYADRFSLRTLVETGTFYGAMVLAMKNEFTQIYSIELDDRLYARAHSMFAGEPHITITHGDSALKLATILEELDGPALFWLDAHYSGSGTARSNLDTPIATELDLIFKHRISDHVILIDDAHDFGRLPDYPTLEWTRVWVKDQRPDWIFEATDNIIRVHSPVWKADIAAS